MRRRHNEQDTFKNHGTLYLVEGPTDALRMYLSNYLTIAALGITTTPERVEFIAKLLIQLETIFGVDIRLATVQDNDGPGTKLATRILRAFPGTKSIRLPHTKKDICNLNDEELDSLLLQ